MKKVNSVVAKALAQKTLSELKTIINKEAKEQQVALSDAIDNDPLTLKFNEKLKEADELLKTLHKKYKEISNGFNTGSYSKKTVSIKDYTYFSGHNFSVPSEEDIKNDIILTQAACEDGSFDPETILKSLLEKYKKQIKK